MTGYMVEFKINGEYKWTQLKADTAADADRIVRDYMTKTYAGEYKPIRICELGKGKNGRVWEALN